MELFDSHCHVANLSDIPGEIEQAIAMGIRTFVGPACDLVECRCYLDMVRSGTYPNLHVALGVHPSVANLEEAETVISLIRDNRDIVVAVGEVGLDFWRGPDHDVQIAVFRRFIEIAKELQLPLIVHSRSADKQAIAVLSEMEMPWDRVIMHSCGGKFGSVQSAIQGGALFSVPPSSHRDGQKRKLFRHIPLGQALLETDAPAIRGVSKDEPGRMVDLQLSLSFLADVYGLPIDEIAAATTANAKRFFGV